MEIDNSIDISPRAHVGDRDPLAPDQDTSTAIVSSRSPPTNDRLSAVPSSGMVRDTKSNPNLIDLKNETTRSRKRS